MVEGTPAVVAVLVVLAAVGAVPVAALSGAGVGAQQPATDEAGANESLSPGERFAGVVGVQQADVEGEIEARAFGQRVAAAASNGSAAGVVAAEVADIDERLADLDERIRELERARENGTLSEGEYRARIAQAHAEQRALQRRVNRTERVARELPAAALEAKGVNATAIATLRSRASEMTGPEVAAVARRIAGKNAGKGVGGPPSDAGPPAFVRNGTDASGAPGAPGNGTDPGNGAGPPDEAGPGNGAGPGNQTGPPSDAGAGNQTGPPSDRGPANRTGGPGNQTGPPAESGTGNETGQSGAGANGGDGGDADEGTVRSVTSPGSRS